MLSEVTAGSWPDWIAAIGTSSAFLIAAGSYVRDVRSRREAQARLVYANIIDTQAHVPGDVFPMLANGALIGGSNASVQFLREGSESRYRALEPLVALTVAIHNLSNELVWPARVRAHEINGKRHDFVVATGPVEPGRERVVELICRNPHFPGEPSLGVGLVFRDSSGRWWKRHQWDPIERVHDDPESAYTKEQRQRSRETAILLGLTDGPSEDGERLPIAVRWHRLARRVRAKDPIP